jgi:hypothetical protein
MPKTPRLSVVLSPRLAGDKNLRIWISLPRSPGLPRNCAAARLNSRELDSWEDWNGDFPGQGKGMEDRTAKCLPGTWKRAASGMEIEREEGSEDNLKSFFGRDSSPPTVPLRPAAATHPLHPAAARTKRGRRLPRRLPTNNTLSFFQHKS